MSAATGYDVPGAGKFLSREECKALFDRIVGLASGGGDVSVSLVSQWRGTSTWARNRVYVSSDAHQADIRITRMMRGTTGYSVTTRLDDEGLRQALTEAERTLGYQQESSEPMEREANAAPISQPTLWSDQTETFSAGARAELAQQMIAPAEAAGMLSAGELVIGTRGEAVLDTSGTFRYYPVTNVEVSTNVRDPKRGASGWAGVTDYDLHRVDGAAIAARALSKAQKSANPVAIEPGRYTTILEPQAVADFFGHAVKDVMLDRQIAEQGSGPYAGPRGTSKIGDNMLDQRFQVHADPMDPEGGFIPFDLLSGDPYRSVNWFDQGKLKELSYMKDYALRLMALDQPLRNSSSYRLHAPGIATATLDEMIANTARGLLVTRLSDIQLADYASLTLSGYTRDGLWLIENGKISKAVKNFRFTESPLFAFNNIDQIGTPVRVFDRENAVVVPPIKVRDFSMTALADSV